MISDESGFKGVSMFLLSIDDDLQFGAGAAVVCQAIFGYCL